MEKTLTVYKNKTGHIYYIDNSIDFLNEEILNPDFIMVWENAEMFFNDLKRYQDEGYKIIFK